MFQSTPNLHSLLNSNFKKGQIIGNSPRGPIVSSQQSGSPEIVKPVRNYVSIKSNPLGSISSHASLSQNSLLKHATLQTSKSCGNATFSSFESLKVSNMKRLTELPEMPMPGTEQNIPLRRKSKPKFNTKGSLNDQIDDNIKLSNIETLPPNTQPNFNADDTILASDLDNNLDGSNSILVLGD